ncbi:MAG TPA: DUF488 domain-containing protein [Casimicrobiaceae bacterium]|nr:DUF488 domain-containing protein [Casimicrobiaceae bacterium]
MELPSFYTIGHSNRPLVEFMALLEPPRIELVVDVRTVPRSRSNPQYDGETLARSLAAAGVGYERIASLGGLRGKQRGIAPDINAFWENESFHHYADYAMTAAFRDGLASLRARGSERRCAIMCAEAVWWRCHRRIIADYLLHDGFPVFHIMARERIEPARLTEAARTGPAGTLVYPSGGAAPTTPG